VEHNLQEDWAVVVHKQEAHLMVAAVLMEMAAEAVEAVAVFTAVVEEVDKTLVVLVVEEVEILVCLFQQLQMMDFIQFILLDQAVNLKYFQELELLKY
jgi:hypothetical protein